MPQSVYLRRYICGSLCPDLPWPQFLDHLVRFQAARRIHVLRQNLKQPPELGLAREALAAEDSVDLVVDCCSIHEFSDLRPG